MKRRLFTILSAISLLICIASAALWVRTNMASDLVIYDHDLAGYRRHTFHISSGSSCFEVGFGRTMRQRSMPPTNGWSWWREEPEFFDAKEMDWALRPQIRLPGVRAVWTHRVVHPGDTIWTVRLIIRYWTLTLLSAILPTLWFLSRLRSRKRPRPGFCRACGYDLRASPDRCPECGTAPR